MKTTEQTVGVTWRDLDVGKLSAAGEAARFRKWWALYGAVSLGDRWYQALADDHAGEAPWLDAAEHLTAREKAGPMAGESLRAKAHPSVTELMQKRIEELMQDHRDWHNSNQGFHNGKVTHFIEIAMRWEPTAFVSQAAQLARTIFEVYEANPRDCHPWQSDGSLWPY